MCLTYVTSSTSFAASSIPTPPTDLEDERDGEEVRDSELESTWVELELMRTTSFSAKTRVATSTNNPFSSSEKRGKKKLLEYYYFFDT